MTPPEPATGIDWVDLILNPAIIALLVTIIIGAVYRLVDVKQPRLRIYGPYRHSERESDEDFPAETTFALIVSNTGDGSAFNVAAIGYGCFWQFNPHEGDFGEGKNGGFQEDSYRPTIAPGIALAAYMHCPHPTMDSGVVVLAWEQRTAFRGVRRKSWAIPVRDIPELKGPREAPGEEVASDPRMLVRFGKEKAKEMHSDILRPPR